MAMGLLALWIPSDHVYHPKPYFPFPTLPVMSLALFTVMVKLLFCPTRLKYSIGGHIFTEIPTGGFTLTKYILLLLPTLVTVLTAVTL